MRTDGAGVAGVAGELFSGVRGCVMRVACYRYAYTPLFFVVGATDASIGAVVSIFFAPPILPFGPFALVGSVRSLDPYRFEIARVFPCY